MYTFIKYRCKCFLKNKTLVFWTMVFPIALSTMFYFVFYDMEMDQKIEPFKVAVVDEGNENLKQLIDELSDKKSDNYILNVTFTDKKEGNELVKNENVEAMVILSDTPEIKSINMSYNVTIMKSILNTYQRVYSQVGHIAQNNPQVLATLSMNELMDANLVIHNKDSKGSEGNMNTVYFYTALSLLCMYGALWGATISSDLQGNQSKRAARLNIAPVSKRKLLLVDFALAYLIIAVEMGVLLFYLQNILGVSFGNDLALVIPLCLSGILTTLSCGMLVGSSVRLSWQSKIGLISGGSVILNAFAGMMGTGVPYIVDTYLPFMRYINPADLISRGFSILYYYEDISPIYMNIIILLITGIVLSAIVYIKIRRESYASI